MINFLKAGRLKVSSFFRNPTAIYLTVLLAVFVVSRVIYYTYFGIRYDIGTLNYYWQFIDPVLLKNNLFQSLLYLHQQPPLFNLLLGLSLKISPDHYGNIFWGFYLVLGVVLVFTLFLNMCYLGVYRPLAFVFSVLFMIAPRLVFYENQLFYEYPVIVTFSVALFFLLRFLKDGRVSQGVGLFLSLAVLCLLRPGPQLALFVFSFILVLLFKWNIRQKVLWSVIFPFFILFMVHAKNFIFFHEIMFGTHHQGSCLVFMVVQSLPKDIQNKLVAEGKISPLSLKFYAKSDDSIVTGIPVLDQEKKSGNFINYNQIGYLEAAKQKIRDCIYVGLHYPSGYLSFLKKTFKQYFFVFNWDGRFGSQKSPHFADLNAWYCRMCGAAGINTVGPVLVILYPFLLLCGLCMTIKELMTKEREVTKTAGLIFMLTAIVMMSLTFCLFSFEDQIRYRLEIESFYWIIGGVLLTQIGEWVIKKGNRHAIKGS